MGVCMDRARIHEGIRRMRFTDVLGRSERSELSQMEAAELLGSANAHSAAGVIATAKRGLRAWRIVVWRLRCAELRWPRSSGCWGCIATSTAASR